MSLPSEGLSLCITPLNMVEMLVGWWDGKETRMEVELWERSAPAHCVDGRSCDTYQNFVHALWLVNELSHAAVSPPLLDLLDLCS